MGQARPGLGGHGSLARGGDIGGIVGDDAITGKTGPATKPAPKPATATKKTAGPAADPGAQHSRGNDEGFAESVRYDFNPFDEAAGQTGKTGKRGAK